MPDSSSLLFPSDTERTNLLEYKHRIMYLSDTSSPEDEIPLCMSRKSVSERNRREQVKRGTEKEKEIASGYGLSQ
ncbi:MAG: hypothetical protein IT388_04940 [Nitrospirales bacterium]|nr:hypothetical protein [Nitrospirales bacterium]